MARILHYFFSSASRRNLHHILAFSWILGLGFGVLLFRYAGNCLSSLMPGAIQRSLSITCLLGSLILPFLLSAFAVYVSKPEWLIPIAFCKAMLYSYISCGILFSFGEAGWLVRILLLFSDTLGNGALYLYWYRHIHGFRGFSAGSCCRYLGFYLLISLADCYFFAPLLRFDSL